MHTELTKYYVLNPPVAVGVTADGTSTTTSSAAIAGTTGAGTTIATAAAVSTTTSAGTPSAATTAAVADIQAWFKQADICRER